MIKGETMTLGEFRKWTNNLSDDVKLNFSYASADYPITAMDSIDENNIVLGGDLYDEANIMGSVRVSTFCKQK
jgi:hypothetical protein